MQHILAAIWSGNYTHHTFGVNNPMTSAYRWTSADLDALPDDEGKRYEIIDGELFVSTTPHFYHQQICSKLLASNA